MSFVYTFIISCAVSLAVYPLVRKLAFFSNAISVPKKERHIHSKPMPLMGGLAIIAGFLAAILLNILINRDFSGGRELTGFLCGLAIIITMGLLDDIVELNPLFKILFQMAAAVTAVLISGSRIEFFTHPGSLTSVILLNPVVSFLISISWIVALTIAFNTIDGLDGLASGTGAICAITLFAVSLLRPDAQVLGSYSAVITIALAGACLGFLPFNFNPAKIFMGETGSAFIGFTLAMISMQGTLKSYTALSIFIPVVAFGLPLLDSVIAFVRRTIKGQPFYKGDRQHIHHKLTDDLGFSQRTTVLILYGASIILGTMSVIMARSGMKNIGILLISMGIVLVAVIAFIYRPKKSFISGDTGPESTDETPISEDNDE